MGRGYRRRPGYLWPPLPFQTHSDHGLFTSFLLIDRMGRKIDRAGMGRDFTPSPWVVGVPGCVFSFWPSVLLCFLPDLPALQVPGFTSVGNRAIRSAQAGAVAPGGGTRQHGPAPLRSPACKYLRPLGESYYSACAPHAKSLSKHAQMTALGIPRHAFYPCLGLVTIVLRPRGSALLVTLWRATLYTPHPGPPQGSIFSHLGPAELAWPLPESGSGW